MDDNKFLPIDADANSAADAVKGVTKFPQRWPWHQCSFCERHYPMMLNVRAIEEAWFCRGPIGGEGVWKLVMAHALPSLVHLYNLDVTCDYDRWCCIHCASNEGFIGIGVYNSMQKAFDESEEFADWLFAPSTRDERCGKEFLTLGPLVSIFQTQMDAGKSGM